MGMTELKKEQELSNEQIDYQKSYCKKLATRYEDYTEEALKFVFSAYYQPEVWEDASQVYKKAITDFLPLDKSEIPVLFVGANAQNRITRKANATGFLLTDHMIYVKEASIFNDTLPLSYPYSASKIEAIEVLEKAMKVFDWEYLETILPPQIKKELTQLMREAITDILTVKETLEIAHIERLKAGDVEGRFAELGLKNNSLIKMGSDESHQKHFRKVIKKFGIPQAETIQFAITDSTFVGPYGLVVTEQAIYSKDTLEKPESTKRNDLEKRYPFKIVEDSILLGANIAHILPSSLKESEKESVKTVLQEYLNEEIHL